MTFFDAVLLFFAAFASGAANAVAGGGTFLTFGAMTLVGLPPIVANATSSVTQLPGYITSTLAYWARLPVRSFCSRSPIRHSGRWCHGCSSPPPPCLPPGLG